MSKDKVMGILMDPISQISYRKDTTLALLEAAQRQGWRLLYLEPDDLHVRGAEVVMSARPLEVRMDADNWFSLGQRRDVHPSDMRALLMRKDPPFNMEFVYFTYLLEVLERQGVAVINRPSGLRDLNEKAALVYCAEVAPEFIISRNMAELAAFAQEQGGAVLKPLDGMGGQSIYRLRPGDTNVPVILEDMTQYGQRTVMAQQFVPEISEGDRRVFVIAGKVADMMLVRRAAAGELRGNLAAGGQGEVMSIGATEKHIAQVVAPLLKQKGILFAGLDVIGKYLTEINVTSPTGLREVAAAGHDLAADVVMAVEMTSA